MLPSCPTGRVKTSTNSEVGDAISKTRSIKTSARSRAALRRCLLADVVTASEKRRVSEELVRSKWIVLMSPDSFRDSCSKLASWEVKL